MIACIHCGGTSPCHLCDDKDKRIEELADHIEELRQGIEDFIHGDDGDVAFYRKQLRGLLDKGGE